MKELTEEFVRLAEQRDPASIEIFLSIISNWQDYNDAEKVKYLNSLDKNSVLLLHQIGASGVSNAFSFLVIVGEGIMPRTIYEFLGLLLLRLIADMELLDMTMIRIFNQSMDFLAFTDHRNN